MPPIIWPNANCGPQLSRAKYPAATKLLKAPEPGKSSLRWQLLAPSAPPVSSPPSPAQPRSKRAKHEPEICERCRLRQQNPPATPDNSAAFWEEEFKNRLFRITNLKNRLLGRRPASV